MSGYSELVYHHIQDQRTQKQRQRQHHLVRELTNRNLKALKIQLTQKKKTEYAPSTKQRVDLGNGWYCNITDNRNAARHTFLTLHGAPGDHVEWAGLETQMGKSCRWVNLTTPGFDGEDQRRGNYDGSAAHFSLLIIKLIKHLGVKQVILCAHSLGSIFSSYFITHHPQYVEGYVNITGIVDQWYTGLMTFFQTSIAEHGFNSAQWRAKRLWDDDHQRILLHHKFLSVAQGRCFGPVEFPKMTITEFFAYSRLLNTMPNGASELFNLNRNLKILRVLVFGEKDPIHEPQKTEESIYNLCWGDSYLKLPQFERLFKTIKTPLEQRLKREFGVQIEGEKVQEYLCFHLYDTGHNAHKRRPIQMSKMFKIYMICLEVMQEHSSIMHSKL